MGSRTQGKKNILTLAIRSQLLVSLGLAATAPGILAAEGPQKWACSADSDGRWVCSGSKPAGPTFERPRHTETAASGDPETRPLSPASNLDWVDQSLLTEDEKARVRPHCCGAYIEPERDYPDAEKDPDGAPIRVSATTTEAQGSVANLEGDVQVHQGYRQVRSRRAQVDQANRTVHLEGNVNFREPGLLLTGDEADINMHSGEVDIDNARFVLHDSGVRGSAGNLARDQDNIIHIDNATYTTCEPGNTAWLLKAANVDIDRARNHVTAKHMRLNVRGVPVVYVPWIRFPASDDRASGLLFPQIATGNDNGIDYAQPIYLNLAPNYDATLTPRYIQHRGAVMEAEVRHLGRWGATSLSGAFLSSDDGGDVETEDTTGLRPYEGEDRWMVNLDHRGRLPGGITSLIDFTDVSDVDYFRDLDTATLEVNSQSHLNQQVAFDYRTRHWQFGANAQQYETIIENGVEQYKQLPRLDANGSYRLGDTDLSLSARHHAVLFDHSQDDVVGSGPAFTRDDEGTYVTGSRFRADYSLSWDKQWLWGFFRPTAMFKHVTYNLDNPLRDSDDKSPQITVPVGSIDAGIYLERDTQWLGGFIQTLEPRLYYLYSGYEDQSAIPNFDTKELTFDYQQLFRDDRFSGGDRIGDTEQLSLGLTSRFIDAATGQERFRVSAGQIFYMDDRRVTLTQTDEELIQTESNIASAFAATFGDYWRIQGDVLLDDKGGAVEKGSASLRYNNREATLFNLAYRYTSEEQATNTNFNDTDQIDASFALPVSDSWRLLGRYNFDLTSNQEIEMFAGLEYTSCCWSVSLLARRWVDRDDSQLIASLDELDHQEGLFLQFQLKGLAGTGTRISNILADGIYGYQPAED